MQRTRTSWAIIKEDYIRIISAFFGQILASSLEGKTKTKNGIHYFFELLNSILRKNHAGPVEKLISDFFRMPKKVGAIDSL